ncbi:MAG: hypothetical protein ABIP36_08615 [Acidimicrobiales bacterium]
MMARLGALIVVAALAVGCGDDEASLSATASERLVEQVAAVRAAATNGDAAAAELHLAAIEASVEELSAAGELNTLAARQVMAAVEAVQAQLGSLPTTTTTTTTTAPPPPEEGDDEGKKGNGRGNADDED